MAETISLYETFNQTGASAQVVLSGTLTVDYSAMTAISQNGLFLAPPQGMTGPTDTFTNFTFAPNSDGTYTITSTSGADSFSINYTGQAPTALNNTSMAKYQAANYGSPSGQVASSQAPCFAQGTRIAVVRDGRREDVAVEELRVGDEAVTVDGALRKITWLGPRRLDCRHNPRPQQVMPVRIRAHAFGTDRPSRDLVLSPDHAICVDLLGGVLIPAAALINGATVVQEDVESVTYWHVEIGAHGVVVAENLSCESYVDIGNRAFFSESQLVELNASPAAAPGGRIDFCHPREERGAIVDATRMQLRRRAESLGWRLSDALDLHLECDGRRIDGVVLGRTVRFHVPAGAQELWLVSPTARCCDTTGHKDFRSLGLCVGALRIEDGFGAPLDVALDDPCLAEGFHVHEGVRRWTNGRARLAAELWQGRDNDFFLRIDLAEWPVPRWTSPDVAPLAENDVGARPLLALVG